MNNEDIKKFIRRHGLFRYEVAEALGISESKFSKMFRTPLSEELKEKIVQTVYRLTEDK